MTTPLHKVFRIFVASPGDCNREREALAGVVNELNRTIGALIPDALVRLELVRWEKNAFPDMGRPQAVINDQIGDYDVFVGLLWRRFGTPTGVAESGTEEEFRIAFENWRQFHRPHILFYFNQERISIPRAVAEVEQLTRVVGFRADLEAKGIIWEYDGAQIFPDVVRPHLLEVVGRLIRASRTGAPAAEAQAQLSPARMAPVRGARVRITDIAERDAYYQGRDDLIGLTATLLDVDDINDVTAAGDEWYSGKLRIDEPRFNGDDCEYTFLAFKFAPLVGEHLALRNRG